MRVFNQIEDLPVFQNAVITIGSFDGIHQGHQHLIHKIQSEATKIDGEAILIIFDPHPRAVLSPCQKFSKINTLTEKIDNLEKMGLSNLIIAPFSKEFASLSADKYIEDFILKKFKPHTLVLGYDHKFGYNRSGDIHSFKSFQSRYNFNLIEIQPQLIDDITISSTKVRKALLEGDVDLAAKYLGYHYSISGTVVRGNQIGRTIGFPTANIGSIDPLKLIPQNGVYKVNVFVQNKTYKGALNIGIRPTINGLHQVIEVHILDFDQDIYDVVIRIEFVHYIRSEKKFDGLHALKIQIAEDIKNCK